MSEDELRQLIEHFDIDLDEEAEERNRKMDELCTWITQLKTKLELLGWDEGPAIMVTVNLALHWHAKP